MLRPVPCSALSEPSNSSVTRRHDVTQERVEPRDVGVVAQPGRDQEVQVARRRVAEDHGVVGVPGEQRLQRQGSLGQPLRREADVLEDERRPRRPCAADAGEQAVADHPVLGRELGVAGERRRLQQRHAGQQCVGRGLGPGGLLRCLVAELHEQAGRGRGQVVPARRHPGAPAHRGDRRTVHQLHGRGPGGDERRHRRARGLHVREQHQRRQVVGVVGDGVEDRLGDEPERALGPDHQAAQDLGGGVGVEERVHGVAGRVLDPELGADPLGRVGVGAGSRRGSRPARRRSPARPPPGARRHRGPRCRRRCPRAARWSSTEGSGTSSRPCRSTSRWRCWPRPRRSWRRPSMPGRDPAGSRGASGRRWRGPGSSPACCAGSAAVLDGAPDPVPHDLDEDPVALGLPGQAGPRRAEGHGDRVGVPVGQDLLDVADVPGEHDHLREHPVRAGVGREPDEVEPPAEHHRRVTEELLEVRAQARWAACGHAVRGAVGARRRGLHDVGAHRGLEQLAHGQQACTPGAAMS